MALCPRSASIAILCSTALAAVVFCAYNSNSNNNESLLNNPNNRRLAALSSFTDPKKVTPRLRDPVNTPILSTDAVEVSPYSTFLPPSDIDTVTPLNNFFHEHEADLDAACDRVILYYTDDFGGHGIGSQLNTYLIASWMATYLDYALVLVGEHTNYMGCPDEMLEKNNEVPGSLSRLVNQPSWLSRQCPIPCQKSIDWSSRKFLRAVRADHNAKEVVCENDNGRQAQVLVVAGYATISHFDQHVKSQMVDRTQQQSINAASNWALRLGASSEEATLFSSLTDEELIWDYISALTGRSGLLRFQPWIARDVEQYVQENNFPVAAEVGHKYASIHVRRGDKVLRESKQWVNKYWAEHANPDEPPQDYIPFKHYLTQFRGMCGYQHVYVASDDPTTIMKEIDNMPKDENGFPILKEDNECVRFQFTFGPVLEGYHNQWMHRDATQCKNLYTRIIASIADLTTLIRSDLFVGEYNANFGRLVRLFRMRIVNGDNVVEKDLRIAWGNSQAKYIHSRNWKNVADLEKEQPIASTIDQSSSQWVDTLWIDIDAFTEGISGWKQVLLEVINVVQNIPRATMVEPCMINGRLLNCGTPNQYPEGAVGEPVPVSEIYELGWAFVSNNGQPPVMASHAEYLHRNQLGIRKSTQFKACLKGSGPCNEPFKDVKRSWNAVHESINNENEITTFTVQTCWWGRCGLELQRHLSIHGKTALRDTPNYKYGSLHFNPKLLETVQGVLANANILDSYSIIHWRAEKKGLDYAACAKSILDAKQNMANAIQNMDDGNTNQDHPVLLMSSLDKDITKMWNGEIQLNKGGDPAEALDFLEKNGLIKFDNLLKESNVIVRDPGMYAIYDLVLAASSRSFATCLRAPECTDVQNAICGRCNYIGKFAQLAVDLRLETPGLEESTHKCWPVQDADLLNLW